MTSPRELLESKISPWLRLLTPIVMALIFFILTSMNGGISEIAAEVKAVRSDLSNHAERITAVETAVSIHHGPGGRVQ